MIAVVLSGTLDDRAAGALDVKRRGGVVAVQDPDDATYPGMPRSVMDATGTDLVAPAHELADLVVKLSQEQVDTGDVRRCCE